MKKQILFTVIVLLCTLFVVCLSCEGDSIQTSGGFHTVTDTAIRLSADIPPQSEANTSIVRPAVRLYLFRGLPFTLDSIKLISVIQIMLMALLIGLFIKPESPEIEYIFDSDGKK
ncbi:MAG: hypothetical protein IJC91_06690 [Oscillospiraceae bacterium]|nr:hypothetical protein [Oscillospiraceae bacterium]